MKLVPVRTTLCMFVVVMLCSSLNAQTATSVSPAAVPRLVNFSGSATDRRGKVTVGVVGVTFSIYRDQYEGAPLWMETQNVQTDKGGNYTVQLGATKSDGLPLEVLSTGGARWLGVRINAGEEQPRVLLLSVPYALKAADAETVGGLPASAFVLAAPASGGVSSAPIDAASGASAAVVPPPATITGAGTTNFVPLFTGAATLGNSVLFQSGSGTTAKVGINTSTPAATLDVKGTGTFRGALTLPATASATTAAGKTSQPLNLIASTLNSVSGTPVNQTFRLQTEPVGNNTSTTSGTLNLLYASGANAATETGLKIASNGNITFAAGQTFPGTGPGTVKRVGLSAPSSDFTVSASPITTSGTLGLNWKVAPTSANTANAIVKRDGSGGFETGFVQVMGLNSSAPTDTGTAVDGYSVAGDGIYGGSSTGVGVAAIAYSGTGLLAESSNGYGVDGSSFYGTGIHGLGVYGVVGETYGSGAGVDGVDGFSHDIVGSGVGALNDAGGDGLYAAATNGGFAGFFLGDVEVDGNFSKAGGSFKIDHPLDPANKYLYHSFVESPDMKNIYDGNVTTDVQGQALVVLPPWFEDLNRDFRYQLTVIGQFAQAIVASEIANHRFTIKTDKPNVKVSWQVTGIRQDAWANAHRIPVEQAKPEKERGFYLHPELFGAPNERSIAWARHPATMKRQKEKPPTVPLVRPLPTSVKQ